MVKDIVKNYRVQFSHYRAGYLYNKVSVAAGDYSFPVPITDIGDATFLNQEKAIVMMRYIRKALNEGTLVSAT